MKFLVCMKRVIDTETRIKIAADGRSIDASGVTYIIAPYDEMAVEKALQLRDASSGEVVVATIGPAEATKELRTALAMGADRALHVVADGVLDAGATAEILAGLVKKEQPDIVLLGKQATDDDDAAVGPMLAALLDWPCVAFIDGLDVDGSSAVVRRELEGEVERLRVALPAVFTAQKGLAEPRYPGLKGIMAAKKKPLESMALPETASRTVVRSLALPPAREAMVSIPPTAEGMRTLLETLRVQKKVL